MNTAKSAEKITTTNTNTAEMTTGLVTSADGTPIGSVAVSGACQGRVRGGADSGRMNSSAIAVSGLRKTYGDKTVLDGIDLDVPAGTVFSLLGRMGRARRRR